MLRSACASHREPASQSQKTPAAEPAQERLATCKFTVYCVEWPSRAALPGPAQPLALQPVIRSGSSGPGELLRQLEMPGWLGCGVWTGQPALDEPLLQRVDGACALVCASDKWLAFVLRVGQNGCKCGDKYCKPCVTPVLVTAERAAPVVSRSAHQPTDPEATILRLGCLRGEGWALGISAQKA